MITLAEKTLTLFLTFLLGYTLGVLNPAYYMVRRSHGRDIRECGSGNAGATNAGRLLGWRGFLAVLLLDGAKGAIAVGLARWVSDDGWVAMGALAGAVVGHIWPVQLGFRGGKGISTLLGGLLVVDLASVVILVMLFLPIWAVTKRFMLSGLLALALFPMGLLFQQAALPQMLGTWSLVGVVWFAHRHDLRAEIFRLLGRTTSCQQNIPPGR
jgi:glycerol-3-phosphate acyltransferase PlsY